MDYIVSNYVIKLDVIDVAQLVDKTEFNNTIEQLIETMIRNRKYFKNLDEEIRRYVHRNSPLVLTWLFSNIYDKIREIEIVEKRRVA